MKKILILLIVCYLSQNLSAQIIVVDEPSKNYSYYQNQLTQLPEEIQFSQGIDALIYTALRGNQVHLTSNQKLPIPLAYAYKDLAFFCKIEVQLEKSVKMPIKFRLGSVDYVDYLEGKRDSY